VTTAVGVLTALGSLFGLVVLGSIIPVVPTGAVVSATAVLAVHRDPVTPVVVVAVGALAAYVGDAVTYAACRAGGEPLTRKLTLYRGTMKLADKVSARLRERPTSALLISRLLPAGRIPMLLAAAVADLPWRRFAVANIIPCVLWSAVYATIGLFGGAVFREPWQGVLAVVGLVLVLSLIAGRIRRRTDTRADAPV
jgi:membrane protein DedA with SNARE-associated domain